MPKPKSSLFMQFRKQPNRLNTNLWSLLLIFFESDVAETEIIETVPVDLKRIH